MSRLTILQVAHDHPDWVAGGSELVARDLTRALDARDGTCARLLVAATALHRPEAEPGSLGALGEDLVLRTGAYDRFSMMRRDGLTWIDALGRLLDQLRPDVVHLHGLDRIGAGVLPVIRRHAPRARVVLTLHDYQFICVNDGLMLTAPEGARCHGARPDACRRCVPDLDAAHHALRKAALIAILQGVDAFVAPSAFLRARFVEWGLPADRIRLIPNAVPGHGGPAGAGAPRPAPDRFAFFGNVSRHKGILVLLDAAARLKAAGSPASVAIHGGLGWADAEFRAAFDTGLAAAAPTARHLGPYHRREIATLMRGADWVVMPSLWWENAPLVLEEARAAGRPVIVSGIGGMAETVTDGVDGLHVAPGDAVALAETMATAAADPALWARLAQAGRPASHAGFVDAHLELYSTLRERMAA